jgi:OTU domain-containing protein 6
MAHAAQEAEGGPGSEGSSGLRPAAAAAGGRRRQSLVALVSLLPSALQAVQQGEGEGEGEGGDAPPGGWAAVPNSAPDLPPDHHAPGAWSAVTGEDGQVYFHRASTGETRWNLPDSVSHADVIAWDSDDPSAGEGEGEGEGEGGGAAAADAEDAGATAEDEGARKRRKAREKAARKAERQRTEAAEREARIEEENAAAGPLPRDVESATILRRMSQFGADWRIKEIPSDGHCMYRALADQLRVQGRLADFGLPAAGAHVQLRKRAAQHMLANAANFQPFCTEDDFPKYCADVETTAQWGSQMELQALCHSLRTEIWVHAADSDAIKMGTEYDEGSAKALQLTFHLHYYAMGEHYNSVATSAATGAGAT